MSDDPCIDLLNQYGVPFVAIGRIDDPEIPQADNDQLVRQTLDGLAAAVRMAAA